MSLSSKYEDESGTIYLTGVQALVRVLLDQRRADRRNGLRTAGLVSGYPGSPLGGVDIELGRRAALLRSHDVVHLPAVNEELAATAVFGTQMSGTVPSVDVDGIFGMWFGKAPGADRSTDAFRHGNYRGTSPHGGVLVVAGDDPNAESSILPTDSSLLFEDLRMPVLCPGSVQEVLDLGLHGYALSRTSGLAVGVKLVNDVAESAGTALVHPHRIRPTAPLLTVDGADFHPQVRPNTAGGAGIVEVERELSAGRLAAAAAYLTENAINEVVGAEQAWLGIVAAGKTYRDLRQALVDLGLTDTELGRLGVRLLHLRCVYPIDEQLIRRFAAGLDRILVLEEKRPLIEGRIKQALYASAHRPEVLGKTGPNGEPLVPDFGELSPDTIARTVGQQIASRAVVTSVEERLGVLDRPVRRDLVVLPRRTAYFCSGCPHSSSLNVPDGTLVGAGIGCHIMALAAERPQFGELVGFTQMGGEGAQWLGLAPFADGWHIVQNLGDGTFFHSGSLAVRQAVSAGATITYKLLYNSAVAMTGGQPAVGARGLTALVDLLKAEGVARIVITSDRPQRGWQRRRQHGVEVWPRERLVEAQRLLQATPGVTVLIHDQQCAAEKRRDRKRRGAPTDDSRLWIDQRVCEGCGDCGAKSNCLSVQPVDTPLGRKTRIDQGSCNLDRTCSRGDCPAFLEVRVKTDRAPAVIPPPPTDLADPIRQVPTDGFTAYIMGVGGTGVVTVNQVLGTAAALEGHGVVSLDHTGSSQKAGPVTSILRLVPDGQDAVPAVSRGQADLYLACDLLVAADEVHLDKTDARRSVGVVSTSEIPTGRMVTDLGQAFPDGSTTVARIATRCRPDVGACVDAVGLAGSLFHDHVYANVLLLGAAYQTGAVPVSAAAIEEALRLNGVQVEANIAAFRWGRTAVAAPHRVPALVEQRPRPAPLEAPSAVRRMATEADIPSELIQPFTWRLADLVDYQSHGYARDYARFVEWVAHQERERVGGHTVTAAVIEGLYKLMAYKDEYETARLHLLPGQRAELQAEFGEDFRVRYLLHPPILRALGLQHKVAFGMWFTPVLRALRAMRRLRGTAMDPFGYTRVRRVERALIEHYTAVLRATVSQIERRDVAVVCQLASLPEAIRGYEGVKLVAVAAYLAETDRLLSTLDLHVAIPPALAQLLGGVASEAGQEPPTLLSSPG